MPNYKYHQPWATVAATGELLSGAFPWKSASGTPTLEIANEETIEDEK